MEWVRHSQKTVVFCSGNCFLAIISWLAQKSQEYAEDDLESGPKGWSQAPEERHRECPKGVVEFD